MRTAAITFLAVFFLHFTIADAAALNISSETSGREIMEAVYQRHQQYPYVYEEQSMILIDQFGNKDTRKIRRYSRMGAKGSADYLLLFDSPSDVKGVAMLARREPSGVTTQAFYLPAFGMAMFENGAGDGQQSENFLGTDYSIENLIGESLDTHVHKRRADQSIDDTDYYIIDVFSLTDDVDEIPLRRHYIRKEILFIVRTDHFDDLGRLRKRQTQHDLINVHGNMWRANMMMMENRNQDHRTIIKIDKRVFSADYVPAEVFTEAWLFENQSMPVHNPGEAP